MNITTIVAIVAFVSFLVICVIMLSAWRRGSKARNASIKAIEQSINDVVFELSEMNTTWKNTYERIDFEKKREEEPTDVTSGGEISLDFADFENFDDIELDDIELFDSTPDIQTVYNTGKSGKTYTAEELESLIKE